MSIVERLGGSSVAKVRLNFNTRKIFCKNDARKRKDVHRRQSGSGALPILHSNQVQFEWRDEGERFFTRSAGAVVGLDFERVLSFGQVDGDGEDDEVFRVGRDVLHRTGRIQLAPKRQFPEAFAIGAQYQDTVTLQDILAAARRVSFSMPVVPSRPLVMACSSSGSCVSSLSRPSHSIKTTPLSGMSERL